MRFLSRDEVNTAESKENAVEVDVKVEAPDVITPEMVATMESMTQKGAKMSIPIKVCFRYIGLSRSSTSELFIYLPMKKLVRYIFSFAFMCADIFFCLLNFQI